MYGNYYDKYATRNPAERLVVDRFLGVIRRAVTEQAPLTLLDMGCGEGVVTAMFARTLPEAMVVGSDIGHAFLRDHAAGRVSHLVATRLPDHCFRAKGFDLVVLSEVLEHLEDPDAALASLVPVAGKALLVTVPWEPWWRGLNLLRLKYLKDFGNTPGHLHHFSQTSLSRLLSRYFTQVKLHTCFPWIVATCLTGQENAKTEGITP